MRKGRWFIRFILAIIALLLFTTTVSARVLFSDWTTSEEPVVTDDLSFVTKYYSQNDRAVIYMDDTRMVLRKGACEEQDSIRYCFLSTDFGGHARYETGKEYAGIKLLITLLEPQLKVERTISPTTPKIGEKVTINGKIKNIGDATADDIVYAEDFPSWLRLTYSTTKMAGNGVRMSMSYLRPGNERPFRYVIEPRDYKEYDSAPTLSYSFGGESGKVDVEPIFLTVQSPIGIKENFSSHIAKLFEEVTYTITLQNKGPRGDIMVNEFAIRIPEGIEIAQFSNNLVKQGNALLFDHIVKKGEKETLQMVMRPVKDGVYVIETFADLTVNDLPIRRELRQKLRVSATDIVPELEITPKQAKEGEDYHVRITLTNQGEEDIGDTDSSLSGVKELPLEFNNRAVLKGRTLELYDAELEVPELNASITRTIRFDGVYNDSSGRHYPFSAEDTITFVPAEKIIDIRQELPAAMMPGENRTISVFVKNRKAERLDGVEMATTLQRGAHAIDGEPYTTITLDPNEEKEAYRFTLYVSPTYKKSVVDVKTVANAIYQETFIKTARQGSISIGKQGAQEGTAETIDKRPAQPDASASPTQETRQEQAEMATSEKGRKEGFLAGLTRWLRALLG